MSAGYFLAYFFVYSLYYVPGLHVLEAPYACWLLGPVLAAIATYHGSVNRTMRWVTPVFTLMVTGHALFHALTSTEVVNIGFATVKVAAIGCVAGALWCAYLSRVYGRLQLRYRWPVDSVQEAADYLLHRVAHELYFVLGALNAMALPVVLGNYSDAPLWWSVIAPLLLAASWRNGNWYKHGVVGFIWGAAAVNLLSLAYGGGVDLHVLLSVPLSGLTIGLAYRFLKSEMAHNLKVSGYCLYLYGGMGIALLVPYLQFPSVYDCMPYWMGAALALCGLGLALRDRIVHDAGWVSGLVALALFGLQWETWTWGLVGPVIACSYALSVSYSLIVKRGGWKAAEFLPFDWTETVSVEGARRLENLWSWVGVFVLLAGTYLLISHDEAVLWWSAQALALVALSSAVASERYRLQGYLAFALAAGKLVFWDTLGGSLGWHPEAMFTLYRSAEFAVFGTCSLIASILLFREEAKLSAALKAPAPSADAPASSEDGSNGSQDSSAGN